VLTFLALFAVNYLVSMGYAEVAGR
jgi:hypothetical protein